MSALPTFSMKDLLDAGVHFGHKTLRWNPRMAPFLFGVRNDIHIINLQLTMPMLYNALKALHEVASKNGRVLFVGTKRQASDIISEQAKRCGQYYINSRWLGGLLTNWNTVSASIKTLTKYEEQLKDENSPLTKKEKLQVEREKSKLEKSLGGIKDMGGLPDILFIIDTNKEEIAVKEAQKLGIPIVAVVDSNSCPDNIDYMIPGNDDATRAIKLYCELAADAVLKGMEKALASSGADIGASAKLPGEKVADLETARAANANQSAGQAEAVAKTESEGKEAAESKKRGAAARKPAAGKAKKEAPAKKAPEVVKKKSVSSKNKTKGE